jgi:hypothetical protein
MDQRSGAKLAPATRRLHHATIAHPWKSAFPHSVEVDPGWRMITWLFPPSHLSIDAGVT